MHVGDGPTLDDARPSPRPSKAHTDPSQRSRKIQLPKALPGRAVGPEEGARTAETTKPCHETGPISDTPRRSLSQATTRAKHRSRRRKINVNAAPPVRFVHRVYLPHITPYARPQVRAHGSQSTPEGAAREGSFVTQEHRSRATCLARVLRCVRRSHWASQPGVLRTARIGATRTVLRVSGDGHVIPDNACPTSAFRKRAGVQQCLETSLPST